MKLFFSAADIAADTTSSLTPNIPPSPTTNAYRFLSPPLLQKTEMRPNFRKTLKSYGPGAYWLIDGRICFKFVMKTKHITALFAVALVAVNALGQEVIYFQNTPGTPVIDGTTGLPVAYGVAVAGLYFSTDLTAVPHPDMPRDAFTLAAITPITPYSWWWQGVYWGRSVPLPGVTEGQNVLFQVRGWSQEYATYEDAVNSPDALIGASNLMLIPLVGGPFPVPTISTIVQSFTLTPVPEPTPYQLLLVTALLSSFWIATSGLFKNCR